MTKFYGYSKLGALSSVLRDVGHSEGKRIFMLPSLSGRDCLLDMTGTERGFWGALGASPEIWSWSEMYARLTPRERLRRQVDPPDHKLILEFVIGNNIEELDERGVKFPHGVRRRGFIDILSSTVRELLLEGVPPDILLSSDGPDSTISHGELLYSR